MQIYNSIGGSHVVLFLQGDGIGLLIQRLKAKFHYASIHRQTRSRTNSNPACRDSSNPDADWFAVGFRSAFDRPATRTRHAGLRPGLRPG